MEPNIPNYLFGFITFASALLLGLVLGLVWFGVARMAVTARERAATAGVLSSALIGWLALTIFLGRENVFWAVNNPTVPTIQFGVLIPIALGLWLLTRSARVGRLVDAIPLPWLVGVQFYRALGLVFLVLWWGGSLPWQFALPAGIGDFATGVLALVVAAMVAGKAAGAHRAVYAWCLFGIADLVIAVTMGALTSPGRIQFLSLDAPNIITTAYPLVMIPIFAVPLSIILHGACLWKLRRMGDGAPVTKEAPV